MINNIVNYFISLFLGLIFVFVLSLFIFQVKVSIIYGFTTWEYYSWHKVPYLTYKLNKDKLEKIRTSIDNEQSKTYKTIVNSHQKQLSMYSHNVLISSTKQTPEIDANANENNIENQSLNVYKEEACYYLKRNFNHGILNNIEVLLLSSDSIFLCLLDKDKLLDKFNKLIIHTNDENKKIDIENIFHNNRNRQECEDLIIKDENFSFLNWSLLSKLEIKDEIVIHCSNNNYDSVNYNTNSKHKE